MNCCKSYLKKYDSDKSHTDTGTDNENEPTINIILSKKKNNFHNEMSGDNFISFFDKVEELYLKLKFINTNKNTNFTHINNYDNDNNYNNNNDNQNNNNNDNDITISKNDDIINNLNIYNLNTIDEVIMKLDRKIICDGMIKRNKNLIEYEF